MKIEGLDYPHIPDDFPLADFLRDLDERGTAGRHATALAFVDRWFKVVRELAEAKGTIIELQRLLEAPPPSESAPDWLM